MEPKRRTISNCRVELDRREVDGTNGNLEGPRGGANAAWSGTRLQTIYADWPTDTRVLVERPMQQDQHYGNRLVRGYPWIGPRSRTRITAAVRLGWLSDRHEGTRGGVHTAGPWSRRQGTLADRQAQDYPWRGSRSKIRITTGVRLRWPVDRYDSP